jgi:hypothetical protein
MSRQRVLRHPPFPRYGDETPSRYAMATAFTPNNTPNASLTEIDCSNRQLSRLRQRYPTADVRDLFRQASKIWLSEYIHHDRKKYTLLGSEQAFEKFKDSVSDLP